MSRLGAYLDWERELDQSAAIPGWVSAYVLFKNSGSVLLADTLNIISGIPQIVVTTLDADYLAELDSLGTDINGLIELDEAILAPGTPVNAILPASLAGRIEILYLGSRHNVPDAGTLATSFGNSREPPNPGGAPIFGIIDDGIGVFNARFTRKKSRAEVAEDPDAGNIQSRFISCWLQSRLGPGKELDRSEIEAYLRRHGESRYESDLYKEVNATHLPAAQHRSVELASSHGTHLADIAAGAEWDDTVDHMRDVDILGVQLPSESIADTAGRRLEINIMQGVRWIILRTLEYMSNNPDEGRRPLIINISLGITAGAKNGTGFLETYLQREIEYFKQLSPGTPIEIILAFGNDRRTQQIGEVKLNAQVNQGVVRWLLHPDDRSAGYLEIRPGKGVLKIGVKPPGSSAFQGPFALPEGSNKDIQSASGELIGRLYREPSDLLVNSTEPVYTLATKPTGGFARDSSGATSKAASGVWEILISKGENVQEIAVQVQRGDTPIGYRRHGRQSYLFDEDGYRFDTETRNWEAPSPAGVVRVIRKSTHSSIASAAPPPLPPPAGEVHIYSAGASIKKKLSFGPISQPALYTGIGSNGAVMRLPLQPDFSADGDDSRILPGVLATGTQTGTASRLAGTSVSAPQVVRWRMSLYYPLIPPPTIRSVAPGQEASLGDNHIDNQGRGRRDSRAVVD